MLHEYRAEISELKSKDPHFAKIFEKHNELDHDIANLENKTTYANDFELDRLKKEKLRLKDEIHLMVVKYKQSKG